MAIIDGERPARQPFLVAPAVVLWLIGALVAAHLCRIWAPPPWPEALLFEFAFIPARYSEAALAASGIPAPGFAEWTVPFVSYMFLHGGYAHLGINSLWLLAFGPIVATRLKAARFLLFFFFCGIVSAVVHLGIYFGAVEQVVGASGAVAGLMGAAIRIFFGRHYFGRGLPPEATPPLAPLMSRHVLGFTLIWLITNVVAGVTGLGLTEPGAAIAWVAHLGGYFAGLLSIALFDRPSPAARAA